MGGNLTLDFRFGRGKFTSLAERFKALNSVLAITEWFVFRETAPAQRNDRACPQTVRSPNSVLNCEIALYPNGTVIENSDLC